jgi:hypothetical protein
MIWIPVGETAADPFNFKAFADLGGLSEARGFVQWAAAVVEEIRGRVRNGSASSFLPYRGKNSSSSLRINKVSK